MRLTEKQAIILLNVFQWSLHVAGDIEGYSQELRLKLVNEILNQQSEKLIELGNLKEEKEEVES